jgi:PST family polysaccharide transporter
MDLIKINKIIEKISPKSLRTKYSSIIENYLSLFAINIINYLSSFITFPYLVRVLRVEGYGLLSLAQSLAGYFAILSNYGFDIIGIQKVAIKREDKKESGKILATVIGAKILFVFIGSLIFNILLFLTPKLKANYPIFALCYIAIFVEALNPYWFFRGIEKLTSITWLTIASKGIYAIGIFILVKSTNDLSLVPIWGSLANSLVALGAFLLILKSGYKPILPRFKFIVNIIRESLVISLTQISKSLNAVSSTFILGILTNNACVGYFAAAQKIVNIVGTFVIIMQQAAFPYVNRLITLSKENSRRFLKKYVALTAVYSGGLSIIILFGAKIIIKILLGETYLPSLPIFRILSFFLFLTGLENTLSILIMIPIGFKNELAKILWISSIINIIITTLLVKSFTYTGAAIAITITESLIVGLLYTYLKKKNVL